MNLKERVLDRYLCRRFSKELQLDLGEPISLPPVGQKQPAVLYLHIPFCESLCPFCSFHRVKLKRERARRYFKALAQELRVIADKGYKPQIVYVGGGTPTILPDELAAILELTRTLFPVEQVSVETNPNHLRDDVLRMLADANVDRLSVGIQTFDNYLLKQMQRYTPYGSGEQNRERLKAAAGRLGTLNVDMIFNLPGQTEQSLQRDLNALVEDIGVDQISMYPLMASRRTSKAMSETMGHYGLDNEQRFYSSIRQRLDSHYQLSSVWCFSRSRGLTDEYIIDDTSYVGAGSGAFSYVDGVVYANTFSINRYCRWTEKSAAAITAHRRLADYQRAQYDMIMAFFGLSLNEDEYRKKYDGRFFRLLQREFLGLKLAGATRTKGGRISLTRDGEYLWIIMMRQFFSGVNNFRDQMRDHVRAEWKMHRAR